MEEEATLNSLPLPQDLLEEIFHRLTYAPLLQAKQVCREWKRVVESPGFTGSYRGTATIVQHHRTVTDQVIHDGDNNVLRPIRRNLCFSEWACSKTGLLALQEGMLYVGDLLRDKWEAVPMPEAPPVYCKRRNNLAAFGFGDGRYKLVYWHQYKGIYTRESEEQEWMLQSSPPDEGYWPDPVVIGNSLFRYDDVNQKLVEFSSVRDRWTAVDLKCKEEFRLKYVHRKMLIAWENRVYLLRMFDVDEDNKRLGYEVMELWTISTGGACTLVMKHEIKETVAFLFGAEIKDGKLVVQYERPLEWRTVILICDMETKKLESFGLDQKPSLMHTLKWRG